MRWIVKIRDHGFVLGLCVKPDGSLTIYLSPAVLMVWVVPHPPSSKNGTNNGTMTMGIVEM
jgi:hypothetical protein